MTAPRFHGGGPKAPVIPVSGGDGMSLRDLFAAAALAGLLAREISYYEQGYPYTAYAFADAMLEERENGGDQ